MSKFIDGLLASCNLGCGSGRRQPTGESLLARARAGQREKFEQRAFSKDIQIDDIGMSLVEERAARIACADPTIFDASQASFIEGDCALGSTSHRAYLLVTND